MPIKRGQKMPEVPCFNVSLVGGSVVLHMNMPMTRDLLTFLEDPDGMEAHEFSLRQQLSAVIAADDRRRGNNKS